MKYLKQLLRKWYRFRIRLHKRSWILGAAVHLLSIAVTSFCLVFVFTIFILQPYRVSGNSMYPTLHDGDRLFVLRFGKIMANLTGSDHVPKRGDIVVFHSALKDNKWIKRVVGLPGERIVLKNNQITIYNEEFPQGFKLDWQFDPPLPDFPTSEPKIDRLVKRSEIFVIGDNRLPQQSSDSRGVLGNISLEDVDGKVVIRIIPVFQFRFF